jgi:hypothetical protein
MDAAEQNRPFDQRPAVSEGDIPVDIKEEEEDSAKHQSSPTDRSMLELHPRFDSNRLRELLKEATDNEKRMPYAYYEVKVCESLAIARKVGWEEDINLKALQLHHLLELRQCLSELTPDEILNYESQKHEMELIHPQIERQYDLIKTLLHIASGLAVKYGIYSRDQFNYRCAGRCVCVHVLDMEKFNSDVYTIDLLWFTNAVYMEPFETVIEDCVREFGKILIKSTIDLFASILSLNEEPPENIERLKGALSMKDRQLEELLHWVPDEEATDVPEFARLKLPGNFLIRFCALRRSRKLALLLRLLKEFDSVYRQFEKALIANFIVITNAKKNILDGL